MPHVLEVAPTGRAKCRGCGERLAKGDVRLGERIPNPFAEGETTLWFHPTCGAYKRPEVLLEALTATSPPPEDDDALRAIAERGRAHRRLPRVDGVERAKSARARCRHCRETIAKDLWRIPLVFYQEGQFEKSGFLHVSCAAEYFETDDLLDALLHFGGPLSEEDVAELKAALST